MSQDSTNEIDYPYNYVPTESVCIFFVVLFSVSTVVHIAQAFRFRLWWLFPTAVLCGLLEILGWSGRLWSSRNPTLHKAFVMQISTTILAPTPFIAASFIILGRITKRLGPQYCRLSFKWYTILFISCDIIALIVQSIGGGIASTTQPVLGGNIMLGGIVLQLVVLALYTALATEFLIRFNADRPRRYIRESGVSHPRGTVDKPMKYMLSAMAVMVILLVIRSIYRTIELSDGWTGTVISTQWLFDVFDGAMVVLAMFTLSLFHPGVLLPGPDKLEADTGEVREKDPQSP